ncbi:MAG: hypothetical protein HXY30_19775 [Pseudorhodoplanes sp.]|nr:hypothetical protein [Pseudorhodoplanes sp.]
MLLACAIIAGAAASLSYGSYWTFVQHQEREDREDMAATQTKVAQAIVLEKLRDEYVAIHGNVSPAVTAKLTMPPADWINRRLEEMGADWRYP